METESMIILALGKDLSEKDKIFPEYCRDKDRHRYSESNLFSFQLSCFHFGKIQNVIDQREQLPAAFKRKIEMLLLFLVQIPGVLICNQFDKPDYMIQGCLDFVALGSKKLALCIVGGFCRLFGLS